MGLIRFWSSGTSAGLSTWALQAEAQTVILLLCTRSLTQATSHGQLNPAHRRDETSDAAVSNQEQVAHAAWLACGLMQRIKQDPLSHCSLGLFPALNLPFAQAVVLALPADWLPQLNARAWGRRTQGSTPAPAFLHRLRLLLSNRNFNERRLPSKEWMPRKRKNRIMSSAGKEKEICCEQRQSDALGPAKRKELLVTLGAPRPALAKTDLSSDLLRCNRLSFPCNR